METGIIVIYHGINKMMNHFKSHWKSISFQKCLTSIPRSSVDWKNLFVHNHCPVQPVQFELPLLDHTSAAHDAILVLHASAQSAETEPLKADLQSSEGVDIKDSETGCNSVAMIIVHDSLVPLHPDPCQGAALEGNTVH